jgi:hypothetical protein
MTNLAPEPPQKNVHFMKSNALLSGKTGCLESFILNSHLLSFQPTIDDSLQ